MDTKKTTKKPKETETLLPQSNESETTQAQAAATEAEQLQAAQAQDVSDTEAKTQAADETQPKEKSQEQETQAQEADTSEAQEQESEANEEAQEQSDVANNDKAIIYAGVTLVRNKTPKPICLSPIQLGIIATITIQSGEVVALPHKYARSLIMQNCFEQVSGTFGIP